MVSNFPRLFGAPDETPLRPAMPEADGYGDRMLDRIREAFCGLHGHDTMLQFQKRRMFLKCVSCGHETPGWSLDETPPIALAGSEKRKQVPAGRQLSSERKIA